MNKFLIVAVIILVALNATLLITNKRQAVEIEELLNSSNVWGYEKVGTSPSSIKNDEIKLPQKGLYLISVLTEKGCVTCLENEIRNLNELYAQYEDLIYVYIQSENKRYFEQFYITFPVIFISSKDKILDNNFTFHNPVTMVVDSSRYVHLIDVAEVGNSSKKNHFYNQVRSIFQSLTDKASE